jgi:L-threonylcarbamoyladenylate synthase
MAPRVLPADAPSSIDQAVDVLRRGGLVAFPTETVYGLGARALDAEHLAKIFAAKGRPTSHPLIAHADGVEMARGLASSFGPAATRLAEAFFPGPLTLVVPRAAHVPAAIAGGGSSVGVRVPARPEALALIRALGEPIAAPSANKYQSLSPTLAEHVVRSLGDAVDLVLDGGPCASGIESTVLDVRGAPVRLLRPGALSLARIRDVVGEVLVEEVVPAADTERLSPGLDEKHYAPRARLRIVSRDALVRELRDLRDLPESPLEGRLGVVWLGTDGSPNLDQRVVSVVLPADAEAYGSALFAALHSLDERGVSAIRVEAVEATEAWMAVADRLRRAST